MKKIILSIAALTAVMCYANAQFTICTNDTTTEVTVYEEDWAEVSLSDLNENVQQAIKDIEGYEVKKLEYNEENGQTKATLVSSEDETEKVVIIDNEGNIIE